MIYALALKLFGRLMSDEIKARVLAAWMIRAFGGNRESR